MLSDSEALNYFVTGALFGVVLQWWCWRLRDSAYQAHNITPTFTIVNTIEASGFEPIQEGEDEGDQDGDDWWKRGGKPST